MCTYAFKIKLSLAQEVCRSRSALLASQFFEFAARRSVCEQLASVVERLLRSLEMSLICNPNFWKTCWVEVAINPLTPTSTVNKEGFHRDLLAMFSSRGKYFAFFLTWAASIPSSAGQVSSIRIDHPFGLRKPDYNIRSLCSCKYFWRKNKI